MSETKFTDGPWNWEHDQDTASMIQVFSESSGDRDVCRLQHEPDAHLIKTSPKMYEMLKCLSDMMPMLDEQTHPQIEMDAVKHDIDNLLAEARGEK